MYSLGIYCLLPVSELWINIHTLFSQRTRQSVLEVVFCLVLQKMKLWNHVGHWGIQQVRLSWWSVWVEGILFVCWIAHTFLSTSLSPYWSWIWSSMKIMMVLLNCSFLEKKRIIQNQCNTKCYRKKAHQQDETH